jgi:hypothetical protein
MLLVAKDFHRRSLVVKGETQDQKRIEGGTRRRRRRRIFIVLRHRHKIIFEELIEIQKFEILRRNNFLILQTKFKILST